jgi:hypothetical protein
MHLDDPNARPQGGNIGPIRREIVFEPLPDPADPGAPAAPAEPTESPPTESPPAEPVRRSEPAPVPS